MHVVDGIEGHDISAAVYGLGDDVACLAVHGPILVGIDYYVFFGVVAECEVQGKRVMILSCAVASRSAPSGSGLFPRRGGARAKFCRSRHRQRSLSGLCCDGTLSGFGHRT